MENSSIKEQIAAQNIIKQINNNPTPSGQVSISSKGICPQCGLIHPPVNPGETCSMAPIKTQDNKVIDPTEFLSKMKFIISNQLEQKGVNNVDKFFQHLTVELTKAMESYIE